VPEQITFEVEMAIEKLKRHKLSDSDQIPAELFKAMGRIIHSEIYAVTINPYPANMQNMVSS